MFIMRRALSCASASSERWSWFVAKIGPTAPEAKFAQEIKPLGS